jgi:hypothetical protein
LVESQALVVLLTPNSANSANVAVEIGAAMAWQKPIYVLLDRVPPDRFPHLEPYRTFPLRDIDKLVRTLRRAGPSLSGAEREALKDVYRDLDTPMDLLLEDTESLEKLTDEFNRRTHAGLAGEDLARELLRLQKSSGLPRLQLTHK